MNFSQDSDNTARITHLQASMNGEVVTDIQWLLHTLPRHNQPLYGERILLNRLYASSP